MIHLGGIKDELGCALSRIGAREIFPVCCPFPPQLSGHVGLHASPDEDLAVAEQCLDGERHDRAKKQDAADRDGNLRRR